MGWPVGLKAGQGGRGDGRGRKCPCKDRMQCSRASVSGCRRALGGGGRRGQPCCDCRCQRAWRPGGVEHLFRLGGRLCRSAHSRLAAPIWRRRQRKKEADRRPRCPPPPPPKASRACGAQDACKTGPSRSETRQRGGSCAEEPRRPSSPSMSGPGPAVWRRALHCIATATALPRGGGDMWVRELRITQASSARSRSATWSAVGVSAKRRGAW